MRNHQNHFEFTGAILKEGNQFVSLCLEVDVATQGRTIREAKKMLAEAVVLHLETCFESNLPYLRPVPKSEDPRVNPPDSLAKTFPLQVDAKVRAVA